MTDHAYKLFEEAELTEMNFWLSDNPASSQRFNYTTALSPCLI